VSVDADRVAAIYARVEAVDVRSLPLGPEEAYVLSLVDGKSPPRTIATATGVSLDRVLAQLRRLEELGAVRLVASSSLRPPASRKPTGTASTPRFVRPVSVPPVSVPPVSVRSVTVQPVAVRSVTVPPGTVSLRPSALPPNTPSRAPAVPSAPPFDVAMAKLLYPELDEALDLLPELQIRILTLSEKLADLNHFEVLGVEPAADRAVVKRAYFSMVGAFHPDTYFGKRLGGFTKRMEKIFQRLTEAHDVLSNRQAREEYEAYLAALGHTKRIEALANEAPPSLEEIERLLFAAEQQARRPTPEPLQSPMPEPIINSVPEPLENPLSRPSAPPAERRNSLPPADRRTPGDRRPSPRPVEMVDDPAARRQALARKLGLSPTPSPVPAVQPDELAKDHAARRNAAVKDFHQRYQHRKGAILEQRVDRFAQAAEAALASGNAVSALNTLKIAQTLSGGDAAVMARFADLERQLGATVADTYLQRARYEESNGHYEQAARSYTRAARGRPDADVLRSAAECYLKAGVELRQAGELARESVQIAPDRVDLRLTLAKIYEAAGMHQSAVRELERALELTPDSDRIKQWLKRTKRGGV
jgi:curved DNA-binding protein CbpA